MTKPPTRIELDCPRCGELFEAYYRPSIDLGLGEPWTEEKIREATAAACPRCAFVVELDALVVDGRGDEEHPARRVL